MSVIAFLDVEASGLGEDSYPVEIAVVLADDETLEPGLSESWLIRPADEWPDYAWDPIAEELHGLQRFALKRDGLSAWTVAERLAAALAGATAVYSDAPDRDGCWLEKLYAESPLPCLTGLREYKALIRAELGGPRSRARPDGPVRGPCRGGPGAPGDPPRTAGCAAPARYVEPRLARRTWRRRWLTPWA